VSTDPRTAALRLLARREHSSAELRAKLQQRGYPAAAIGPVVDALQAQGLLSDERYAEALIATRVERGYGPMRIAAELRQSELPQTVIEQALAATQVDWARQVEQVRRKRFGESFPVDFAERARQARFLHYRGFTAEQIQHALRAGHEE
jgi:regulatory protein